MAPFGAESAGFGLRWYLNSGACIAIDRALHRIPGIEGEQPLGSSPEA